MPHAGWRVLVVAFVCSLGLNVYLLVSSSQPFLNKDTSQKSSDGADLRPKSASASNEVFDFGVFGTYAEDRGHAGHARTLSSNSHPSHHQHDAMLFLFLMLIVGAAVMHISGHVKGMQQTVVLFVLGMIFSAFFYSLELAAKTSVFGVSYTMWMDVDPHLLLFTLLPALLAGDAMTIDTNVAKRVAFQCIYLAGPGVLINALVVAVFLQFYLGWSFLLSLVTGSILCATDPVAVVALLKELGASPTLTIQIQGESLINDGTAIVLYSIAYKMLSGEKFDAADITMFLVRTALMAWALGMLIGYLFFCWIRKAGNKLDHHSNMIQITLTLCCAYWSFIMAEGVFGISGVLSCVAASLVLAHHMWPHIVSRDTLHHVWHTFESLGNIVIFFLAGALTGKTMVSIKAIEYVHLFVIYVVLLIVRGGLIFASKPVLRMLSPTGRPVSNADAIVMTWGGLRGAVGLALAIQVYNGRAPDDNDVPQIGEYDGKRVLFFVSGIALLTTIINATTAPALVNYLGITAVPAVQRDFIEMFVRQLAHWSEDHKQPEQVTVRLRSMIAAVRQACTGGHALKFTEEFSRSHSMSNFDDNHFRVSENRAVVNDFQAAKKRYEEVKAEAVEFTMIRDFPSTSLLGKADGMCELLAKAEVNPDMARVVNKTFLMIVAAQYWNMIEEMDLRPGSEEAEVLLTSVQLALGPVDVDLTDFTYIHTHLKKFNIGVDHHSRMSRAFFDDADEGVCAPHKEISIGTSTPESVKRIRVLVNSNGFNSIVGCAILLSLMYMYAESRLRNDANTENVGWLVGEIVFYSIFVFEFVFKFIALRLNYFYDGWNIFDFVLVLSGGFGVAFNLLARTKEQEYGDTSIVRVALSFRVLRLLRMFRLLEFFLKLTRMWNASPETASRFHKLTVVDCFVQAHLVSQVELVKYFGGNGLIDELKEADMARCILQSQIFVYRALAMACEYERLMDQDMIKELKWTIETKDVIESLEKFVMSAFKCGALSGREAEAILHPMHHDIEDCLLEMKEITTGGRVISTNSSRMDLSENWAHKVVPAPSGDSFE